MLNLVKQAEERAETVKVKSKHRVYNVLDIAGYVVNTNINKGIRMRRYRLDLFLYFIQGYSYLLTGEPIFSAPVLARNFKRPYTEWADNYFGNKYKIRPIPKIEIYFDKHNGIKKLGKLSFNPHITMSDRELIDDILANLNESSTRELKYSMECSGLVKQAMHRLDRTITGTMFLKQAENVEQLYQQISQELEKYLHTL